jgi:hypothetical protein
MGNKTDLHCWECKYLRVCYGILTVEEKEICSNFIKKEDKNEAKS